MSGSPVLTGHFPRHVHLDVAEEVYIYLYIYVYIYAAAALTQHISFKCEL